MLLAVLSTKNSDQVDEPSSSACRLIPGKPQQYSMNHSSSGLPRDIPFHLLEAITDGFSKERKIGAGTFGKVYMGVHNNGERIAVKMLKDTPGLEEEQFLNEFNNLARLQHPNIVRLIGYCYETQKQYVEYDGRLLFAELIRRALCFEYMPYGSLDKYLTDEYHGLDWNMRYTLIKGICKGLKYLHKELKSPIYHLDLKPANILLDENMLPKIADFGLSRFFGEEQTQITKSSVGTPGYQPPEYIERSIISNKFDIFSLGVVIIKIMTGSTGYSRSTEMTPKEFIELVHENWRNRLQEKATPAHLLESYSTQVKGCIEIALSSIEVDRHKRPNIGDIIKRLDEMEILVSSPASAVELQWMGISAEPTQVPNPAFNRDTLQRQLQAITEGSTEAWCYAIFWQYSVDAVTGSSLLGWGEGYYQGCKEDELCKLWPHYTYTPAVKAEQEHRQRVVRELNSLINGNNASPAHEDVEVSDTEWSSLISMMQSFQGGSGVPGHEQEHRKRIFSKLSSLLSGYAVRNHMNGPQQVTDREWFFLVSMSNSFLRGSGLPGQALLTDQPTWISSDLSSAPCTRACKAYNYGIRTMVCIPVGSGVIELASTDVILKTPQSIPKILSLFRRDVSDERGKSPADMDERGKSPADMDVRGNTKRKHGAP
ncbi:unnamed protein product [Urochloa humidicola]